MIQLTIVESKRQAVDSRKLIGHLTHTNRAVIPRLHDDYEEQRYLERNPVDGGLAMKCFS